MATHQSDGNAPASLTEIAIVFFRLGCIGFGGPAVHIAMMEEQVVRKRRWMTPEHFLDLVGATNLIPGPNSTEMTMHCGHEQAGWKGLVVAGACFIGPAATITAVLAWAYQRYGTLPDAQPFLYGIKPAIIAVVVALMISLGRKALKSFSLGVVGLLSLAATLQGVNEIVLFGAGLIGIVLHAAGRMRGSLRSFFPAIFLLVPSAQQVSPWRLFIIFLKVGSVLYGSGYVLFGFLDAELVTRGLLTKSQLIDAIAVGQITPGPVFSAATFIGWQLAGATGAVAATVGIFLPSFLFVAFLNPFIPKLRKSRVMSAFLDTVNIASVAIIVAVAIEMGRSSIVDWRTVVIAVFGFVCTFFFRRLNSAFVVLGGAALGYALHFV